MSEKNLVLLSWDDSSKAYEAFSRFKVFESSNVRVDSSAVVERTPRGELRVTDGQDSIIGLASLGGSSLGALIGILGGPLGVLLGFAGGGIIGTAIDVNRGDKADGAVGEMSQALPPGRTAIIAEVTEDSTVVIDDFAKTYGAILMRRPEEEVLDELAAAEDAAEAAMKAADKEVREAKKAERKEKRQAQLDKLKARLSGND